MLTHKRDEGLAHITAVIERSGIDEFCRFLSDRVMPDAIGDPDEGDVTAHVVAHMAIIGAVDAMLAFRDSKDETKR